MKKHYYLSNFNKQLFYKCLGFGLYAYDLKSEYWSQFQPTKNKLINVQKKLFKYACCMTLASQILYFYFNYSEHEFQTLQTIYIIVPVTIMVSLKVLLAQTSSYKRVMKNFTEEINLHSLYHKTKGENQTFLEQIIIKTEKYTRWSHFYIYSIIFVCASAFLIVPVYRNIENNNSIHNITTRLNIVIHLWLPFDYEFSFYNYLAIQIIMIYTVYSAISMLVLFDTVNLMFIFHLLGHVKYFKYIVKILAFEQRNMNEKEIKTRLVEITCYYKLIQSMLRRIEAAFGLNIVGMYLHNLIAGGIQIFQLMNVGNDTGELLSYGLMTPLYMGELMIVSFAFEQLRIEGDDIPTLIYNLHWENMSISNQKLVMMILYQTQPILEFKAAFNTKTGVKPALSIIKTTFSYYIIIKSKV